MIFCAEVAGLGVRRQRPVEILPSEEPSQSLLLAGLVKDQVEVFLQLIKVDF